jgi:WD40 repeat protein/serine/threonine protein kinase/tetratricopeptide (TPR) repeat protein
VSTVGGEHVMIECPMREQLKSFLSGSLGTTDEEAICQHVDRCSACQGALEALVGGKTLIHRNEEPEPDTHFLERLKAEQPPDGWMGPNGTGAKRDATALLAAETVASRLALPPEIPGFEVLEEIGRGGMGIVYKARQLGLNRLTAVKMIYTGAIAASDALYRFQSEAEAVAALHHPNIIQIHEIGSHRGNPFFSMEYAANGTLRTQLSKRGLSPREAASLVATLARAIQYAHESGIVHRDLKPANVLLTADNTPKIADFGLAKRLDDLDTKTQTGRILGTPSYMAPEQASGHGNRAGPAVDIYALGAILYELLTGRPPFQGESFESILNLILNAEPVAPRQLKPSLPRDIETVCLKCLEKEPKRRYLSAGALSADLDRFVVGQPVHVRPVGPVERGVRWCRRNPTLAAVWGGFVSALLLGLIGVSWKWWETEIEKNKVVVAERKAVEERDRANLARDESKYLSAGMLLDKGIDLAEKGNVAEGLFWMLEALRAAPEDDRGLRRAARLNVGAWLPLIHGLRQTFRGNFCSMAISPDGRRLATGSRKGEVRLWDVATGTPIGSPALIANAEALAVTFSRDGKSFLVCAEKRVQRFDALGGQAIGKPLLHDEYVHAAVFSPTGTRLATACEDGVARLWDVETGQLLGEPFHDKKTHPVCLAFSPDGTSLAVGTARSYDSKGPAPWVHGGRSLVSAPAAVHLIDLVKGMHSHSLPHQKMVNQVSFSGDGRRLVSACSDGFARLWDAATGQAIGLKMPHPGELWAVDFTPDSTAIVTGYGAGNLGGHRWWDAKTCHPLAAKMPQHGDHEMGLSFSADGRLMATLATVPRGKPDHADIRIWQTARPLSGVVPTSTDEVTLSQPADPRAASETLFSPDVRYALSWDPNDAVARLWDLSTGLPHRAPIRTPWPIRNASFNSNSTRAALSSFDKPGPAGSSVNAFCRVIDVSEGRVSFTLPHANWIESMAFHPDGSVLATGGYDRCVHVWDLATGRQVGGAWRQREIIQALAFSPDGRTLAVSHIGDKYTAAGTTVWEFSGRRTRGPELPHDSAHFSPDGRLLVNSSSTEPIRLWDVATCRVKEPNLASPNPKEWRVAFSPDGKTLLADGTSGSARFWDVVSGQQRGHPLIASREITARAFSPDSRFVLLGYADGLSRLWDAVSQKPVGPHISGDGPVKSAAFASDGRFFFTAGASGIPRKHQLPQADMEEDLELLKLRLEVRTGLTRTEGGLVTELGLPDWRERFNRLVKLEGSAENAYAGSAESRVWHEARLQDAEVEGNDFVARWHLDRILAEIGPSASSEMLHPALFSLHARRARIHSNAGEFVLADVEYAAAGRYSQPSRLTDWFNQRAAECVLASRWNAALWYLDKLIGQQPKWWEGYAARAEVYEKLDRAAERDADLKRAIEQGADGAYLVRIGSDYARQGRWNEAISCFTLAEAREPILFNGWQRHGLALLHLHDADGYRRLTRSLISNAESKVDAGSANEAAWAFVLGPAALDDYAPVLRMLELSLQEIPGTLTRRPGLLNTLGAVLYRAGRYREAIDCLNEGITTRDGIGVSQDWVFLAMAYHKLGNSAEANRWLDLVLKAVKHYTPVAGSLSWNFLELDILRQEAESMIRPNSPSK